MILDPTVQAHLDAEEPMPPGLDLAGIRAHLRRQIDAHFDRFGLPGPHVADVTDHVLPGDDGGTFRVRRYHPEPGRTLPVHVVAHGGGWVTGSIDELVVDASARHRADAAGVVVVSIDYRLAPEHPFPGPLLDVLTALRWVVEEGATWGIDASQISVGGASAGANLVAGAALADPSIRLRGMLLEVPVLDLTLETFRAELAAGTYPPGVENGLDAVAMYVPDESARTDPRVSPLRAPSLADLPPTWVLTAGLDPLRREGSLFVDRLTTDGVEAHLSCYRGALHGSPILNGTWITARRWHDDTLAILRRIHQRDAAETDVALEEVRAP